MGKKARRGRGGGSSTKGAAQNKNKSCIGAAAPPALVLATIDSRGCITKKDEIYLITLVSALAKVALPRLEKERKLSQGAGYKPLEWTQNASNKDMDAPRLMSSYSFNHIDTLSEEIDDGIHDRAFRSIIGRRLSRNDKATIRSWKMHIEDDFFVIEHLSFKGAIFVQALDPQSSENDLRYAPRCFIVRGMSVDWPAVLQHPAKCLANSFARVKIDHPVLRIAFLRATLIPYMDGITYTTFTQPPKYGELNTPEKVHKAIDAAVAASHRAALIENNEAAREANVYYSLDPNKDVTISMLASNVCNDPKFIGINTQRKLKETETDVSAWEWCWTPTATPDDPLFLPTLQAILSGDKKPLMLEGHATKIRIGLVVSDFKPCPFHLPFGDSLRPFVFCCREKYRERAAKSEKKGNPMAVIYEPYTKDERAAYDCSTPSTSRPALSACGYLGFCDIAKIKIEIALESVPFIKERMDRDRTVHATGLYQWLFLGSQPLIRPTVGITFYGHIDLDPSTGVFTGDAKTAHCLEALIETMKQICGEMTVQRAILSSEPSYKVKADKDALERNRLLLQSGWEDMVVVTVTSNKEANASIGRLCAYCGGTGEMDRCPCKAAYYCTRDCQSSHWKDHKAECNRRRETNKEDLSITIN